MIAAIYARVSTEDQNCGLQLTELGGYVERSGWTKLEYVEKASGKAGSKRPMLDKLLEDARLKKFDVVLVWKMDRFGRSLQHLIENVRKLETHGIRFIALTQNIDTDTKSPMGKFLMHIFGAFAEFERDLIVERVGAGLKEYQKEFAAGRVGKDRHSKSGKDLPVGRPSKMFRRDLVVRLRSEGQSWRVIEKKLGVPQSTLRLSMRK